MGTNLHKRFATDSAAETSGAWVDFGEGVRFRVVSDTIARVRELRHRLVWKKYRAYYATMDVPPHIEDTVNIEMACALVVNWEGVQDENGKELPFTAENLRLLVSDLREVRNNILFVAGTAETFRKQEAADIAKNSATPSPVS